MTEAEVRAIVRQEVGAMLAGSMAGGAFTVNCNMVLCAQGADGRVKPLPIDPNSGGIPIDVKTDNFRPLITQAADSSASGAFPTV